MTFAKQTVEVNRKEATANGAKYSKVGEFVVSVPLLDELGIDAKINDEKTKEANDGLPVYDDDRMDWVFRAMVAQAKAQARNKLVSQTATLKEGAKIAENWAELTAEGQRTGNAAALQLVKEIKDNFAKFVATLGKSQNAQQTLNQLFGNKSALALQPAGVKAKMKGYVEQFAGTLEPEQAEKYAKYLESVDTACDAVVEEDEL